MLSDLQVNDIGRSIQVLTSQGALARVADLLKNHAFFEDVAIERSRDALLE